MSESGLPVGVRRRRSRGEAALLVAEYEQSGMSRRVFCESRGISVATLDLYRKRARRPEDDWPPLAAELTSSVSSDSSATPVASSLTVVLSNGRRIELVGAVDAALLEQLVVVLERT